MNAMSASIPVDEIQTVSKYTKNNGKWDWEWDRAWGNAKKKKKKKKGKTVLKSHNLPLNAIDTFMRLDINAVKARTCLAVIFLKLNARLREY